MPRTRRKVDQQEEDKLRSFLDEIAPREPKVRIYRLSPSGKQTRLETVCLSGFDPDEVSRRWGGGTYLLRTIRSDGTWGPSRVFRCM